MISWISIAVVGLSSLRAQAANAPSATARQNSHLRDVLLGRCYENPPMKEQDASLCSLLVDSFGSVLEERLDEDIVPEHFYLYWSMADFDSPQDSALLVWPPPLESSSSPSLLPISRKSHLLLPETSPGGALLQGLVFCGADQRLVCPFEFWKRKVGALSAFWGGAYSMFAQRIHGRVRMLVRDDISKVPALWEENVLPFLNSTRVSGVDIAAVNCNSEGVSELRVSLQSNNNIPVSCTPISDTHNMSSEACTLVELAGYKNPISTVLPNSHNNEAANSKATHSTTGIEGGSIECRCPTGGEVYEYLFWALILLLTACAYSYWSVRHYLLDYHRVPDVSPEHELLATANGHNGQLPKQ